MKILLFWPRQLAHGTLTAQHDSLSTVQDGVCYVTCLCAGREGLVLANDSKAQLKSHEIAMGTPQNTSVFDNWCHSTTKRSVACYFINRSGTRSLVNCKALPLPPVLHGCQHLRGTNGIFTSRLGLLQHHLLSHPHFLLRVVEGPLQVLQLIMPSDLHKTRRIHKLLFFRREKAFVAAKPRCP